MKEMRVLIGTGFLYLFMVLGFVATSHLSFGANHLLLRPVEQDPYLAYQYDLNLIDLDRVKVEGGPFSPGSIAYVILERDGDHARPVALTADRPDRTAIYLRGVVRGRTERGLLVHYGIEGFEIPAERRAEVQALPRPFDVQIEVEPGGQARAVALVAQGRSVRLIPPGGR